MTDIVGTLHQVTTLSKIVSVKRKTKKRPLFAEKKVMFVHPFSVFSDESDNKSDEPNCGKGLSELKKTWFLELPQIFRKNSSIKKDIIFGSKIEST